MKNMFTLNSENVVPMWRAEILALTEQRIPLVFKELPNRLHENADRAPSEVIRARLLAGIGALEKVGPNIHRAFIDNLRKQLKFDLGTAAQPVHSDSELQLLDNDRLESQLILQRVTETLRNDNYPVLQKLSQRLSTLRQNQPVRISEVPASPVRLAEALDHACGLLELSVPVRATLYTLFKELVLESITARYEVLNTALADAGVEANLANPERAFVPKPIQAEPAALIEAAAAAAAAEAAAVWLPQAVDQDASGSAGTVTEIRELLGAHRDSRAPAGHRSPVDPSGERTVLTGAQIARAISERGDQVEARIAPIGILDEIKGMIAIPVGHLDATRRVLAEQREQIKDLVGRDKLAEFDEDTIDIIGQLFEAMLNEASLSAPVKALLSHLHTPFLKIALHDSNILTHPKHPARQLLDEMIDMGARWVVPHKLDKGGFPCLQAATKVLVEKPRPDHRLAAKLVVKVREEADRLHARSRVFIQRVQETEKGRGMLEQARRMAAQHVRGLIGSAPYDRRGHDFLLGPWSDCLSLLLLRNRLQAKGRDWEHVSIIGQHIIETVEKSRAENGQSYEAVKELHEVLKGLVGKLVPHLMGSVDDFIRSMLQPWDETTEEIEVPTPVVADEPAEQLRKLSPQQAQVAKQMRSCEIGSLFQMTAEEGDAPQVVELAWYNAYSDRMLLVDHTGAKVALMPVADFVVSMELGRITRVTSDSASFFDRALQTIRAYIAKKGAKKAAVDD